MSSSGMTPIPPWAWRAVRVKALARIPPPSQAARHTGALARTCCFRRAGPAALIGALVIITTRAFS